MTTNNSPSPDTLDQVAREGGSPARAYLLAELTEAQRQHALAVEYAAELVADRDKASRRVESIEAALADLDRRDELLTARAPAADVVEALERQAARR